MAEDQPYEIIRCQDREEWLKEREKGIGASEAFDSLQRPLKVYHRKLGLADEFEQSEAMRWGLLLEDPIARCYEQDHAQREVSNPGDHTIYRSTMWPFMQATLDRLVTCPERGPGVLEIKTTNAFRGHDWDDEPPAVYQVQLQHQLAVTGLEWGSIAVLIGGQRFINYDLPRNSDFIAWLVRGEEELWARIEDESKGPPPATRDDLDIVKRVYPKAVKDKVIDLPEKCVAMVETFEEASARIKADEKVRDGVEAWLRSEMGDAEKGRLGDGRVVTLKQTQRKAYSVEAGSYRRMRIVAKED